MTREELKEHCKKQVEHCELWAKQNGKEPQGNIYEEHKLILELLEQQPSEDCVSRKDVINYIRTLACDLSYWSVTDEVVKDIESLPPVTPTRKKGKWEYDAYKDRTKGHCNRCGHFMRYGEKTKFCPDCGAEMEGEE